MDLIIHLYCTFQTLQASNGERVVGDSREFSWNSVGQFADGSSVRLEQQIRRDNNDETVGAVLRLNSTITGVCPESLKSPEGSRRVELADFHQPVVQLNPSRGHSAEWRKTGAYKVSNKYPISLPILPQSAKGVATENSLSNYVISKLSNFLKINGDDGTHTEY